MKILFTLTAIVALSVLSFACKDNKPQVMEKPTPATLNVETTRLGTAIDTFVSTPTSVHAASVDRAFSEIDGEIAELDQRVGKLSGAEQAEAKAKSNNLRAYRDKERLRYTEALVRAKAQAANKDTQNLGDKVEAGARKAGEGVKDAAEAVKDGVENAVDVVKDKMP